MSQKITKKKSVELLIPRFRKGETFSNVFREFSEKYGIQERTFIHHWNAAKEAHLKEQERLERIKMEERAEAAKEEVKREIMTEMEILEGLSKIAKGTARMVGSTVIAPSAGEMIKAMEVISKMRGYFAPDRISHDISEPVDWSSVPTEVIEIILSERKPE